MRSDINLVHLANEVALALRRDGIVDAHEYLRLSGSASFGNEVLTAVYSSLFKAKSQSPPADPDAFYSKEA